MLNQNEYRSRPKSACGLQEKKQAQGGYTFSKSTVNTQKHCASAILGLREPMAARSKSRSKSRKSNKSQRRKNSIMIPPSLQGYDEYWQNQN